MLIFFVGLIAEGLAKQNLSACMAEMQQDNCPHMPEVE